MSKIAGVAITSGIAMTQQKFLKKAQLTGLVLLLASSVILTSCATPSKAPSLQHSSAAQTEQISKEQISKEQTSREQISKERISLPIPAPPTASTSTVDAALPASVKASVLQDIASRNSVSIELLTVVGARAKSWPDGCLGLGGPGDICTFATVDGWEVTVSHAEDQWVYRTDSNGTTVKLADNRSVGESSSESE